MTQRMILTLPKNWEVIQFPHFLEVSSLLEPSVQEFPNPKAVAAGYVSLIADGMHNFGSFALILIL